MHAVSILINQALSDHTFQYLVGRGLAYIQQLFHIAAHGMAIGTNEIQEPIRDQGLAPAKQRFRRKAQK